MPAKLRCTLCRAPVDPAFSPFCSRGCRDRDLLSWLGEAYRVPVRMDDDEDGDGDGAKNPDDLSRDGV